MIYFFVEILFRNANENPRKRSLSRHYTTTSYKGNLDKFYNIEYNEFFEIINESILSF